ncbi:hypothetical protein, partial [Gordonia desulfuricans]
MKDSDELVRELPKRSIVLDVPLSLLVVKGPRMRVISDRFPCLLYRRIQQPRIGEMSGMDHSRFPRLL